AATGDVFLLCSDGLTDMVDERRILDLVEENRGDMDAALRALVRAANRGGGEDNITVVAFEITDAAVHDGQTQEQALPPELAARRKVEDEETLDEVDAVPVVDTAVVPTEEIQEQLAVEQRARRRNLRRRVLAWLALLVLLAAIAALVVWRLLS